MELTPLTIKEQNRIIDQALRQHYRESMERKRVPCDYLLMFTEGGESNAVADAIVKEQIAKIQKTIEGNPYSNTDSPLFAKGPPPAIFFPGCPPGCHTGKHTHHSHVPWLYGDPYDYKCVRCGYAAGDSSYGAKGKIYLCDCCWEDWFAISDNLDMQAFLKNG